ncbi:hypothetical protein ACFQ58_10790 [Agromyces sp. NPDC056523]|uniref:hypothetical protein n=1 Tax=Agromyces sp. NPDC056523 TaxID=3345850 RepID=UPI00366E8F33
MDVTDWLLDADPAIRWQVMRDLTDEPAEAVATERARVATEGWGAQLLALQAADGQWGGGTYSPKWISTTYTLLLLRLLGLEPDAPQARAAIDRVREGVTWKRDGDSPFFGGQRETCVNGMVLQLASYFRETGELVDRLLDRVLAEQLDDGGWNCEAPHHSHRSSFNTTILVLEGLLERERSVAPDSAMTAARAHGEEYLLDRRLFRSLSTGAVVTSAWTRFSFPPQWHYDVLRGLEYLRATGRRPDERCADAIDLVRRHRRDDGRWPLQNTHHARTHFQMEDGDGNPSRWNTLRALRVLRWWDGGAGLRSME